MGRINKTALKNALLTALYVIAIGTVLYFGGQAKIGRANTFLVPISILLLLVCSTSITGYLMVGKPILLYIDGKKKRSCLTSCSYARLFFYHHIRSNHSYNIAHALNTCKVKSEEYY